MINCSCTLQNLLQITCLQTSMLLTNSYFRLPLLILVCYFDIYMRRCLLDWLLIDFRCPVQSVVYMSCNLLLRFLQRHRFLILKFHETSCKFIWCWTKNSSESLLWKWVFNVNIIQVLVLDIALLTTSLIWSCLELYWTASCSILSTKT